MWSILTLGSCFPVVSVLTLAAGIRAASLKDTHHSWSRRPWTDSVKLVTAELCHCRKGLVLSTMYSVQSKVKSFYVCFSFTSKFIFDHRSLGRRDFFVQSVFKHFWWALYLGQEGTWATEFLWSKIWREERQTSERMAIFAPNLPPNCKSKMDLRKPSFILLSSPLLLFLFPYSVHIVDNLLSIGEVQARLAMFVKLVGQA